MKALFFALRMALGGAMAWGFCSLTVARGGLVSPGAPERTDGPPGADASPATGTVATRAEINKKKLSAIGDLAKRVAGQEPLDTQAVKAWRTLAQGGDGAPPLPGTGEVQTALYAHRLDMLLSLEEGEVMGMLNALDRYLDLKASMGASDSGADAERARAEKRAMIISAYTDVAYVFMKRRDMVPAAVLLDRLLSRKYPITSEISGFVVRYAEILDEMDDEAQAKKLLTDFIERAKTERPLSVGPAAHRLAIIYSNENDYENVIRCYELYEEYADNPQSKANAMYQMAFLLEMAGDRYAPRMMEACRKILRLYPDTRYARLARNLMKEALTGGVAGGER